VLKLASVSTAEDDVDELSLSVAEVMRMNMYCNRKNTMATTSPMSEFEKNTLMKMAYAISTRHSP
jgi:hypothetical protein